MIIEDYIKESFKRFKRCEGIEGFVCILVLNSISYLFIYLLLIHNHIDISFLEFYKKVTMSNIIIFNLESFKHLIYILMLNPLSLIILKENLFLFYQDFLKFKNLF